MHSNRITQSYYSSPNCRVNFNSYIVQFPDFSNTSYYNLEYRFAITSNNLSPLFNSTSESEVTLNPCDTVTDDYLLKLV